ncbi:hypothetical protein [Prevotella sp. 10(H)]|uniref:hypothetical protein n=1 Tax=Prevotella sp. 10(H) TaxID=1158294 RepID=UPI00068C05B6|nr:hypothetical protein [Prevotella sp. 10(H)]
MQKYSKYKVLHRISYIVFFSYLLILAILKFNFGQYNDYAAYFIIVPFLIYCAIAISITILARKSRSKKYITG